ncbi:MAG: putative ABC transporter permease [Oscillospiraceae bacterium]|nr:putative ABC transporter permease [Oscillospiraceae bacterium]
MRHVTSSLQISMSRIASFHQAIINHMKTVSVYVLIFLTGGIVYCMLELLFRQRTHLSMFFVGGLCVVLLNIIATKSRVAPWKKWIAAGALITTAEFIAGAVVNIWLGLNVWDYSHMRMNLMGQISLSFSLLWVLLSIPTIKILEVIDRTKRQRRGG